MTEQAMLIKETAAETSVENSEAALHIIYGSRSGNSMAAAILAHEFAIHLGIQSYLHDMSTIDPATIASMKNILLAVSTHGEGDPPAVVEDFYAYLHSSEVPAMKGSSFSILALGDSSYTDYCKTGHDFRLRLLALGSEEISPLMECDIDYEENAKAWVRQSVAAFEARLPKTLKPTEKEFAFEINKPETDDDKLFYAKVVELKMLTQPGFEKRTMHKVLSMDKFGTSFQPGDSFGVYAHNSRLLVDKLLKTLAFDGTHAVEVGNKSKLLKEALIHDFEITLITPLVVEKYAEIAQNTQLREFIKDTSHLERYCLVCDVLDLVTDFPSQISPEEFTGILRKLAPRLYSVANSPLVFPDEVHFTIGLMEYSVKNRRHTGVCSTYFADRVEVGDSVPVYLEPNEKFRIPDDDTRPMIMIATGTGIAPFRGFLQQREHSKATGENWLFFGDRHAESDFLYENELEEFRKKGVLSKLNTAFSRDQKHKIYVQHHMLENSKDLFDWIHNRDAVIYICGNKRTMGKDVKATLEKIISSEGKMTAEQTNAYIQKLRTRKRLQTDLY
ncbi:MAG: flavodoxin domain-containing protein [Bacteroidales bacterium]|nr:flavodoxin domain-containing protein [Bacteroidales bacterium]